MKNRRSNAIIGLDVVTSDGHDVGEIEEVEFNTESWSVVGLVIRLKRDVLEDLDLKKPLLGTQHLRVKPDHIGGVGERVVLKQGLGKMAELLHAAHEDEVEAA